MSSPSNDTGTARNNVSSAGAAKPSPMKGVVPMTSTPSPTLESVRWRTGGRRSVAGSHLQDRCRVSAGSQHRGEGLDVRHPAAKNKAVASTPQDGFKIVDDLCIACLVADEVPVD